MGAILRKFHSRSPRYILRPEDSQMLFFAHKGQDAESKHSTKLVNVSETGIAFLVDKTHMPQIGDMIKIEFPIPGSTQIAWWAKVVRLEEYSPSPWWLETDESVSNTEVLVAIQFENLPQGHRRRIKDGLWNRYQALLAQHRLEKRQRLIEFVKENFWHFVLFTLCTIAGLMALYWISTWEPLFDIIKGSKYQDLWKNLNF